MSAIFGVIHLDGKEVKEEHISSFIQEYSTYQIDRIETKKIDHAFMGCGIQYFTKEAEQEILPLVDEENHIFFTADCVLDNRYELCNLLQLSDSLPDGTLIYRAYLKWGKKCTEYLRGIFSFVVYHWDTKEVFFFADHCVNRSLFVHKRGQAIYFSTLLFPLVRASGLDFEINERWLVDCIAYIQPKLITEDRETVYQDVFKISSASILQVSDSTFEYERYWDPGRIKTDYSITEDQVKKELREKLEKSVSASLRTSGNVGIMLSSGLDSSTIGGIAAGELKKEEKNLYSFTSVPLKECNLTRKGSLIFDETQGVMEICKKYPNIIPTFESCEDRNLFQESEKLTEIWELPIKSRHNAVWIDKLFELAQEKGCRVLLDGASGNCTLSGGSIVDYFDEMLKQCKFVTAFKDVFHYLPKLGASKKRFIKYWLSSFITKDRKERENGILVRPEIAKEVRPYERYFANETKQRGIRKMRNYFYVKEYFAQTNEIATKNSLKYGILTRDPFACVDLLEFMYCLPIQYFVNGDYERRLIRDFCADIVPDMIRLDVRHRGRQSGDEKYRVIQYINIHCEDVIRVLCTEHMNKYFDTDMLKKIVESYTDEMDEEDIIVISNMYMISKYLDKVCKK